MTNTIDHPAHYNSHPSGIEAIEVCRWLSFNLGNAFKYVVRRDLKGDRAENLGKALWYCRDETLRWDQHNHAMGGPPVWMYPIIRERAQRMADVETDPDIARLLVCISTAAHARDGRDRLREAIVLLERMVAA